MLITIQIEATNMQDAISQLQGSGIAAVQKPITTTAEPVKTEQPTHTTEAAAKPEKTYLLTEVRAALGDLRKAKGAAAAKGILQAHGVEALSELPESAYGAAIEAAKEALR